MATEVVEADKLISRRFISENHKVITYNHTEKDIKMDIKEKFYQKMGFKLVPHEFCGPCLRKSYT